VRRSRLAWWWVGYVVVWSASVVVFAFPASYLACDDTEPGSARDDYCDGMDDYLGWGEPSEWTTPLPFLLPIVILTLLGAYGIWRRSRRFLQVAAIAALAAIPAHIAVLIFLAD
jgi:hypothetical protein